VAGEGTERKGGGTDRPGGGPLAGPAPGAGSAPPLFVNGEMSAGWRRGLPGHWAGGGPTPTGAAFSMGRGNGADAGWRQAGKGSRKAGGDGARMTRANEAGGAKGELKAGMWEAFSEAGVLARSPDFEFRPQQREMAAEVAAALIEERSVAVEAGTGVGKSLAYLLPAMTYALERGRKAVFSTHTINLQEQLLKKDIPLVRKLTGPFEAVLMKGRGNYLCPARLEAALRQSDDLFGSRESEELRAILKWSRTTEDGTLSDLDFKPLPKVWQQVCSEAEICTVRNCGAKGNCFYQEARKAAGKAQAVVVNHTLFFTLLDPESETGERGYLFGDDFVVFDEAHTLEQVAANQLGIRFSEAGLRFDLQRLHNPRTRKGLLRSLQAARGMVGVEAVLAEAEQFFGALGEAATFRERSREFRVRGPDLVPNTLTEPLCELRGVLELLAEDVDDDLTRAELQERARRLREADAALKLFLDQADEGSVYWVERGGEDLGSYTLRTAPVRVADHLRPLLFADRKTAILTSATLGTGDAELSYFRGRVGAGHVPAVQIGSPFDYRSQMKVFVVRSMPDPSAPEYEGALAGWIGHFLGRSDGRAFVLFTSYRVMQAVAEEIEGVCRREGWRLLVQGSGMPRHRMLQVFRDDVRSVLFGTDSFWTGVDVPGEALSNVIVTRLPFAVPDHPVIAARLEEIEEAGGNPFMEYSVPEAVLKLRQGVGRLIRSANDHGIVVLLDNRVLTRRYGRAFLEALPDAPVEVIQTPLGR